MPQAPHAPLICVIVLNYNGREFLAPCVRAVLQSQGVRLKVLVVDNGSDDGSLETLPSHPDLSVLRNGQNLYFARGNNIGIAAALDLDPAYVCILNNDTVPAPDCFSRLAAFMERTPSAGACQPLLLFQTNPDYVNSRGCLVSLSGKGWDAGFGEPLEALRQRLAAEPPPLQGPWGSALEVPALTGGAMFLRAATLQQVGGFCDHFTMYLEDVDLSLRIRAAGQDLFCLPEALVLHRFGGTVRRRMPLYRLYLCERNSFHVVLRCFPLPLLVLSYALCVPLRLGIALRALLQGRFGYVAAVLGATLLGLGLLPGGLWRRLRDRTPRRDLRPWLSTRHLVPPKPPLIPTVHEEP